MEIQRQNAIALFIVNVGAAEPIVDSILCVWRKSLKSGTIRVSDIVLMVDSTIAISLGFKPQHFSQSTASLVGPQLLN
jgi:hypothetical protein